MFTFTARRRGLLTSTTTPLSNRPLTSQLRRSFATNSRAIANATTRGVSHSPTRSHLPIQTLGIARFSTTHTASMPTTRQQDKGGLASRGKNGSSTTTAEERNKATDCLKHWEDEDHLADNQAAYKEFQAEARKKAAAVAPDSPKPKTAAPPETSIHKDHGDVALGMKRGRGANHRAPEGTKKARSDSGSEVPDMPTGDKTRVPGLGQKVHWKADGDGGYVHGEVIEVLYADKTVEGEKVEASKEDPMLVLTTKEGKGCAQKPENVHFD
jgi:hypothetical protein